MPVRVIGPRDKEPLPEGAVFVNTTSRSKDWGRGFSPFLLGPCELYGGRIAQTVENAWQFSKVYKCHTDAEHNPTDEYWRWAETGWASRRAERYPMGKGAAPEYSLWDGRKLSYVEARREVYVPLYYAAVLGTPAFARLRELYLAGANLVLWDFDGYDNEKLGMSLGQVLDCHDRKMGHAFVLAAMLRKGK
jgi:hypothetical protein